jgi:hypothetical protein
LIVFAIASPKQKNTTGRKSQAAALATFDTNTYLRLAGRRAFDPLGCNFNLPPEVAANPPQAAGTCRWELVAAALCVISGYVGN